MASQVAEPDRIVDHYPPACTPCGAAGPPAMSAGHSARQVFDLPEPTPLVVTEHRAHDCRCTGCGARSRASFPDEVKAPVQYGPRIAAVVIYLLHYQLLPEDRLAELMADLFGIRLVAATIARMSRTCAARLQDFVTAVRDLVAGAPVKHMDETGFRIGGQTQWLWSASWCMTIGSPITRWRACFMPCATPITCVNSRPWSRSRRKTGRARCSSCACHAANLARERGIALNTLRPSLHAQIERRYDAILAQGLAFHQAQSPLAPAATKGKSQRRGRKPRVVRHRRGRPDGAHRSVALGVAAQFEFTLRQIDVIGEFEKISRVQGAQPGAVI